MAATALHPAHTADILPLAFSTHHHRHMNPYRPSQAITTIDTKTDPIKTQPKKLQNLWTPTETNQKP